MHAAIVRAVKPAEPAASEATPLDATAPTETAACCSPANQASCCAPDANAKCCGTTHPAGSCGGRMSHLAVPLSRRMLAEFLGTALLVTAVVGSGIMAHRSRPTTSACSCWRTPSRPRSGSAR